MTHPTSTNIFKQNVYRPIKSFLSLYFCTTTGTEPKRLCILPPSAFHFFISAPVIVERRKFFATDEGIPCILSSTGSPLPKKDLERMNVSNPEFASLHVTFLVVLEGSSPQETGAMVWSLKLFPT